MSTKYGYSCREFAAESREIVPVSKLEFQPPNAAPLLHMQNLDLTAGTEPSSRDYDDACSESMR
jgi:hypothetical protein